ncbi:hypothetical protein N7536_008514 [Penicillium majusculum]|nr:hypothetical protein N7536_008514 [Penicillium majusculum]
MQSTKLVPAQRMSGPEGDIWSVVNEAVKTSTIQPVINLGQGFFGYNPPRYLLDCLKETIERVECNQGRPRLREAIAESYSTHTGREVPLNEILITTGANEGILSIIMAYINPGDEVIIIEPLFDQFIRNVALAGGIPKYVSLSPCSYNDARQAAEWKIDMNELEASISPRTKMVVSADLGEIPKGNAEILNNPHNPTGKSFRHAELQAIGDLCMRHSLIILADELYSRFSLTSPITHVASLFPDITLTVGSIGKDFAATGWRVGFVIGKSSLLAPVATSHRHTCYASPSAAQEAAATGYKQAETNGYWVQLRSSIQQKMETLCTAWEGLGVPPDGGYMVLVSLSGVQIPSGYPFPPRIADADDETKMCWFLINEIGVAGLPSSGFYVRPNESVQKAMLFRFAVCREDETLDVACKRLKKLQEYMSPSVSA